MSDLPVVSPCVMHGCSACCHETEMPLAEEDARRLEALGYVRADFARVLDGALTLRNDPTRADEQGAPCFFLQDGRCSVYADRPAGCRIYPFVLNERRKVVRDEDCPHRGEFRAPPGLERRLLRLVATIERESRANK